MTSTPSRPKPVVLCILDGWGHSTNPDTSHNAIFQAKTPNLDRLSHTYPVSFLDASELNVGLPDGQMGNSEVGHMNIGGGRVVMQDLPRIDRAIQDGSLGKNPNLLDFIAKTKAGSGRVHVMGLLSPGGVHSHQNHMAALINALDAAGIEVLIHAFLDGRDTPPRSARAYLSFFMQQIKPAEKARVVTGMGRYYAMDRDKRWERTELAYRAIVDADGARQESLPAAIDHAYAGTSGDEFVQPSVIGDYDGIHDGDGLLMINFRADRARQILSALLDPGFNSFERARVPAFSAVLGMVEYSAALTKFMPALFPPEALTNSLGEVIANLGMKQLRIAETEKYPHVTYFFNGGMENEFPGEARIMVPSPKVPTYDLKPEMSAFEVTEKMEEAIRSDAYDLIVANFANTDMVGHTGNMEAARKAVETVDACVGRIADLVLEKGGALILSADHGNAEQMFDPGIDQPHTAHTLNRVPFTVIGNGLEKQSLSLKDGILADIAPTVLALMHIPQPKEMTGHSLLLPAQSHSQVSHG